MPLFVILLERTSDVALGRRAFRGRALTVARNSILKPLFASFIFCLAPVPPSSQPGSFPLLSDKSEFPFHISHGQACFDRHPFLPSLKSVSSLHVQLHRRRFTVALIRNLRIPPLLLFFPICLTNRSSLWGRSFLFFSRIPPVVFFYAVPTCGASFWRFSAVDLLTPF